MVTFDFGFSGSQHVRDMEDRIRQMRTSWIKQKSSAWWSLKLHLIPVILSPAFCCGTAQNHPFLSFFYFSLNLSVLELTNSCPEINHLPSFFLPSFFLPPFLLPFLRLSPSLPSFLSSFLPSLLSFLPLLLSFSFFLCKFLCV